MLGFILIRVSKRGNRPQHTKTNLKPWSSFLWNSTSPANDEDPFLSISEEGRKYIVTHFLFFMFCCAGYSYRNSPVFLRLSSECPSARDTAWGNMAKWDRHSPTHQVSRINEAKPCIYFVGYHDDVIKWNIFLVTGTLWGVSTGHRWIPLTKASDAELWRFLWSGLEQTAEQTIETLMFETPLRSLWRHCNVMFIKPGHGTTKARQLRKNVENGFTSPFSQEKYFDPNLMEFCSWKSNWQWVSNDSGHAHLWPRCFFKHNDTCGPFYQYGLTLIQAWISNYIHHKRCKISIR